MGFYRKSVRFFESLVIAIGVRKNSFSEKRAIKIKRPLYKDIRWTEEEKQRFNKYWIEHYGKAIPDWWHKLYQGVNGVFDEKYFPEALYTTELEWRINPKKYAEVLCDKNLLQTIFKIDGLYIPKTYVACTNGIYQDSEKNIITQQKMVEIASNVGCAVVKPTVDSGSGHDVRIVSIENGVDTRTGCSIRDILLKYERNYVIQELIVPCEEIKALSPNCLSTFRAMTYITDNGIFTTPLSMRVGTGDSDVDNIHAGGLCVGVNPDGSLKKYAYRLGYGDNNEKVEVHPDSGIRFENYRIPMIPELLETAKRCHAMIPALGILSWDFAIDKKKRVTLIEVNTQDQSVWFPQMINGEPLFGDNTGCMLEWLKKEKS